MLVHHPVTVLAGITVGNFAFWADSLLVAVLLYYGANSFKRVTEVKCDNQLPYIFQVRLPLPSPQNGPKVPSCSTQPDKLPMHHFGFKSKHIAVAKIKMKLLCDLNGLSRVGMVSPPPTHARTMVGRLFLLSGECAVGCRA